MENLITILIAIIGGLGFMLFRKSKQNTSLKAENDLTKQSEHSKVVDDKVSESQQKIDDIQESIDSDPDEAEGFWEEYTDKKK